MTKKSIGINLKKFSIDETSGHSTAKRSPGNALRVFLAACVVLIAICSTQAFGQVDQGTITGVVQDSSGAVIAGAQVTLENLDTGLAVQTKTNGSGIYVFSPIKIGHYSMSATAKGFETTVQQNLQLNIQEQLNVPLMLKPGAVTETVTVNTAPPLLQTESGSVEQEVSGRTINNTPLAQRNWVYLAQLSPGVAPTPATRGGGTGDFSANGQMSDQNNYLLDGVDNNVNIVDFMNGSTYAVSPPPDAVAEFKLETADFSAEFGHSAGSVLNVSVKSGTNQIHGDVWEYARNTVLDAQNWSAPFNPPYHMNQFGGTLGGPILKNKLFYFGDIQNTRIVYASSANSTLTVPTPLERQGNFSELLTPSNTGGSLPVCLFQPNTEGPGSSSSSGCSGSNLLTYGGQQNVFAPSQIDTVAQNILKLYPLPNANGWTSANNSNTSTTQGKTYNNLNENLPTRNIIAQWDQRLDWNISSRDQAYARYSYNHVYDDLTPPLGLPLDGTTSYAGNRQNYLSENFMLSETHIFNPHLINEFRFGYNWAAYQNLQPNYNVDEALTLGMGGMPFGAGYFENGGIPSVSVSPITAFGSHGNDPSDEGQNIYEILDNVTKIVGNHSLAFGISFQNFRQRLLQPPAPRGAYSYSGTYTGVSGVSNTGNGIADFLADQMNGANITNEPIYNTVWRNDAAYAEDHWKILPRLTLDLGLRYDFFQPTLEQAGRQGNFVPSVQGVGTGQGVYLLPTQDRSIVLNSAYLSNLAADNITLKYDSNPELSTAQMANFAPRVGISYQIDPKTVLRAGFGFFYGDMNPIGSNPDLRYNYPFLDHPSLTAVGCSPGVTCASLGTAAQNYPAAGVTGNPGATLENGLAGPLTLGLANFISSPVIQGRDPALKTTYTESYNLTVQRAFSNNLSASAAYVGNVGRHLLANINSNPPGGLLHAGLSTTNFLAFPLFGGNPFSSYSGMSDYNALQAKLERRYSNGLSYLAAYTWSHALQDTSDPISGGVSYREVPLIPIRDEYTQSQFDVRQRISLVGQYDLPFGKGRQFMNHSWAEDLVAGGWTGSLTFFAESGTPFSVGTSNFSGAAGGSNKAIKVGDPFKAGGSPDPSNPTVTCATTVRNKTHWYNPCAFANPVSGTLIPNTGTTVATATVVTGEANIIPYLGGRSNVIAGPPVNRINMSMYKNFSTFREQQVQFRADVFNLFNHPSLANPSTANNSNTGGLITGFVAFQANVPDARCFQLAAKYVF